MENRENDERRWERISKTFFRAPRKPTRLETESFTAKVMGRLEPAPAFAFLFGWLEARWMIPTLSFGLAALFVSILIPRTESIAPMDELFLTETRTPAAAAWLAPADASSGEALLAPAVEGK